MHHQDDPPTPYAINLHFCLLGRARERIGNQSIPVPSPPPGASVVVYPTIGDIVRLPEFDAFTLQVVAREFEFRVGSLEINCYLDTVAHDPPEVELKLIK